MNKLSTISMWSLVVAAVIVYIVGLTVDVMDIDAAQYASISLEMVHRHDFLTVTERGMDYLDKPPLLFWLSALSFNVFGVNTIAYKLPSLLFSLLTFFSTYKLARFFYSKEVAALSVVITATSQAFFMINNDCRTDTILTGAILFSLYQLVYYIHTKHYLYFVGAFVGVGLAMLSKGPIGFVMPFAIIGIDLMVKKDWNSIFSWHWLWGILILAIMLSPMCIGLYKQFGTKGLSFYFWDQSFGRLTGENEFVKSLSSDDYVNDPFFFYHTFLWAFAPWPLLFIVALFFELKNFIRKKSKLIQGEEVITWAGFMFIFWVMSMSMYKLPHYIVVIFPLAAIVTAKFILNQLQGKLYTWLLYIHLVLMLLLWGICIYLVGISFSLNNTFSLGLIILGFLCTAIVFYKTKQQQRLIYMLSLTILAGNFLLNYHVYPRLLTYQASGDFGRYIFNNKIEKSRLYNFTEMNNALDFYAKEIVHRVYYRDPRSVEDALRSGNYLIVDGQGIEIIKSGEVKHEILMEKENYNVTLLTPEFLNPSTRSQVLRTCYLVKIL